MQASITVVIPIASLVMQAMHQAITTPVNAQIATALVVRGRMYASTTVEAPIVSPATQEMHRQTIIQGSAPTAIIQMDGRGRCSATLGSLTAFLAMRRTGPHTTIRASVLNAITRVNGMIEVVKHYMEIAKRIAFVNHSLHQLASCQQTYPKTGNR